MQSTHVEEEGIEAPMEWRGNVNICAERILRTLAAGGQGASDEDQTRMPAPPLLLAVDVGAIE
jgi:hypothetical protein